MHIHTLYTYYYIQLWARAFRDREFYTAVNTNNGTESLNKLFKYSYLPRKKSMTLSSIVTLIIETFLPESHQKYLFLNYKQSSEYRSYKDFVPEYLHGRPRSTISHCLERRSKSLKYTNEDVTIIDEEKGYFTVMGTSGKKHEVTFSDPSCTCRDWITFHLPCKHFFGIFRLYSKWDWNSLPDSYRNSAYLSTDQSAIEDYFQAPDVPTLESAGNQYQLQGAPPEPLMSDLTATESTIPERTVY